MVPRTSGVVIRSYGVPFGRGTIHPSRIRLGHEQVDAAEDLTAASVFDLAISIHAVLLCSCAFVRFVLGTEASQIQTRKSRTRETTTKLTTTTTTTTTTTKLTTTTMMMTNRKPPMMAMVGFLLSFAIAVAASGKRTALRGVQSNRELFNIADSPLHLPDATSRKVMVTTSSKKKVKKDKDSDD